MYCWKTLNKHLIVFIKTVSGEARGLGEVGSVKSKSKLLIFLHGAFMIGAWICSASLGIILAR